MKSWVQILDKSTCLRQFSFKFYDTLYMFDSGYIYIYIYRERERERERERASSLCKLTFLFLCLHLLAEIASLCLLNVTNG